MLHPSRKLCENRYFIWGIARSGIHATAEWIYGSYPDHRLYLISQTYGEEPISSWQTNSLLADIESHGRRDNFVCSGRWPEDYRSPATVCVVTLENHDIRCYQGDQWAANTLFGRSRRTWNLVLLRSLRNHYASYVMASQAHGGLVCYIRCARGKLHNLNTFPIDLWKMQAAEYLGDTAYLGPKVVRMNYDAWHASAGYRKDLASLLGIENDGRPFQNVPHNGGGSSFDKRTRDGRAEDMKVLERWNRMDEATQAPLLERLDKDSELRELSDRFDANVAALLNGPE